MLAFTVSPTVAVWTREPLVPVIVRVEPPGGVPLEVVIVIADPLTDAVALLGKPVTPKDTVPVNPFTGVIVAV